MLPDLWGYIQLLYSCGPLVYEMENGGMDTCIQKGRITGQRKLSTDYSTPITWESVKRIYFVNKSDYVPQSYPLSKNDSLRVNNIAANPR